MKARAVVLVAAAIGIIIITRETSSINLPTMNHLPAKSCSTQEANKTLSKIKHAASITVKTTALCIKMIKGSSNSSSIRATSILGKRAMLRRILPDPDQTCSNKAFNDSSNRTPREAQ